MPEMTALTCPIPNLDTLPPESLALVLCHLSVKDIRNVAATCKALHVACRDEKMWFILCESTWSSVTDVRQWLVKQREEGRQGQEAPTVSPVTYCELFHVLRHVQDLCGYWRVIGDGPSGSFVRFIWCKDGIRGHAIIPKTFQKMSSFGPSSSQVHSFVELEPYHSLCPRQGEGFVVEWGSEDKGIVTLIKSPKPPPGIAGGKLPSIGGSPRMYRSPSAEAAAAVSMSSMAESSVLGSSPEGSFEHSWLEFMSTKIAKPSRRRRSMRDALDKFTINPKIYHLRRVSLPLPSLCHPLAGIWAGNDSVNGPLVIRIRYDFSGLAARVVGEKISGSGALAAGRQCWWAYAAAVQVPWSASEENLMHSLLEHLDTVALEGLDAILLEDGDQSNVFEDNSNDGNNNVPRIDREIEKIHVGGSKDDDEGAALVEGRLWSLTDGSLMFWWLDPVAPLRRLIMQRLDLDAL